MLMNPPTHGLGPELMVKCPTCSAEAGHKCFNLRGRFKMGDLIHRAREQAYEDWKKSLQGNGFVRAK